MISEILLVVPLEIRSFFRKLHFFQRFSMTSGKDFSIPLAGLHFLVFPEISEQTFEEPIFDPNFESKT